MSRRNSALFLIIGPNMNIMKFAIKMSIMLMSFFIFSSSMVTSPFDGKLKDEYVILLHGMGRTKWSMQKIERHLVKNGYHTININYPSTREPIDTISETHLANVVNKCKIQGAQKIHFVTQTDQCQYQY